MATENNAQVSPQTLQLQDGGTTGTKNQAFRGTFMFGVVAADKEFNSTTIKVYPQELLPTASGNLEATEVKTKVGLPDDRVGDFKGEATLTNTITAEYFNLDTNRFYPPDIRRNEQVILFNYRDSDTWYWYPLGRNDNLRRCERIRLAVSDDTAFKKELDNDNTWYLEFDTLNSKRFTLSTAKSDSEEYRYLFQIDAKLNTLQICDDDNNLILMESKEKRLFLRNSDGSLVDLNKKNATVMAIEDLSLKGGRQVTIESPVLTLSQERDDKAIVIKTKDLAIITEKSLVMESPAVGVNGQVTMPGSLITKYHTSEYTSFGRIVDTDTSTNSDSAQISSLLRTAQLFSVTNVSATSLTTTTAAEVSASSYNPSIIENNRPQVIQTEFKDGWDATTLRPDIASYTGTENTASAYTPVDINLLNGRSTKPNNTPNQTDLENSNNRQCNAWDQTTSAFDRISLGFQKIHEAIDALCDAVRDVPGVKTTLLDTAQQLASTADALAIEARVLGWNSCMPRNGGD